MLGGRIAGSTMWSLSIGHRGSESVGVRYGTGMLAGQTGPQAIHRLDLRPDGHLLTC
jgi:hypothetical protein